MQKAPKMTDPDVEKMCRLCCGTKGRLRPLFETRAENGRSLPDIIFDISRLQVEVNDGMPQKICRLCSTTLLKMYETVENYRNNDQKLRQLFHKKAPVEIKEEEVDLDLLENAFTQDLHVEDISVKEEYMEEEYLESELPNDESNALEGSDELATSELANLKTDIEEEVAEDDEEWKPQKQDKADKESSVKKLPKRRKPKGINTRKPGRPRLRGISPDRPRKYDYKCYICMSDSHGTPEALLAHLNSSHLDLLPFTCPECVMEKVVIKTALALNSHKKQHLNPVKCPYCDKRYTHNNNLAMHVQLHHSEDKSQLSQTCQHCGEVFPSKSSLFHHMKLHTTAVSCEICGKVFKERSKLKRHIENRHEKLRKYECHICKKKLSSIHSVQIHVKTFHCDKAFKCSYCPRMFGSELIHRNHEKIHLDNPDYEPKNDWKEYYTVVDKGTKLRKCNLCGLITRAIGIHLGKVHFPTDHKCKICGMTFKSKQSCTVHEQKHDSNNAVQCPICDKEFAERKLLICHLRTKKHQDHPLALQLLSTVRTPNSGQSVKTEDDVDVDDV